MHLLWQPLLGRKAVQVRGVSLQGLQATGRGCRAKDTMYSNVPNCKIWQALALGTGIPQPLAQTSGCSMAAASAKPAGLAGHPSNWRAETPPTSEEEADSHKRNSKREVLTKRERDSLRETPREMQGQIGSSRMGQNSLHIAPFVSCQGAPDDSAPRKV